MVDLTKLSRDFKLNPIQKGEPIYKQDLIYLHNELNLTNDKSAEILGCTKTKIAHFCFKYGLKKTKQQVLNIMSAANKGKYDTFSEEKKERIKEKQRNIWKNKTKEEMDKWKQIVSKNSEKMWKNMTEENKSAMLQKMSQSGKKRCSNMTEKQKEHRIEAFKNTWYNFSEEKKQEIKIKNRNKGLLQWQTMSEEIKEKRSIKYKNTMSQKTPEELKAIQDKIYQTKKKNNSLYQSKPEKECGLKLKEKFKDVREQYKSEKFPFACDFYIPSLDLYIDLNFHWTHGFKAFNKNSEKDLIKLNKWKQQIGKSKFYENAIYTWTDLDVRKDKLTVENNINRLVFYKEKEFNEWIKEI